MARADLHNHIRTKGKLKDADFNGTIDAAVKRLGNGNGSIIGLANVEDDRYERFCGLRGYERIYAGEEKNALYVPEKSVMVVKGQEVCTRHGHLLVLGIPKDRHLKNNRPLEETIAESKENCGVIIASHPFYKNGLGPYLEENPHLLADFDAIEVHNGEAALGVPILNWPLPCGANERAARFYDSVKIVRPHLGAISASDGHSIREIGSSWVDMSMPGFGSKEFYESLRRDVRFTRYPLFRKDSDSILGALLHVFALVAHGLKNPKKSISS